jgi:AcrR family transcriptional regulator
MTRLARNRDTHLVPDEISARVLRLFDEGATAPSIRQLARALDVAPSAIYHHFPSRAAIYAAAVDLVWQEAIGDLLALVPEPFEAEPAELLVTAGIATRRAFLRHYRIAPYAAATPASAGLLANVLALVAATLERLGLEGEEAAECFHAYASMALGGTIFAATRRIANDELEIPISAQERFSSGNGDQAERSSEATRQAIDDVIDISALDPQRDEDLFVAGLRRLVAGFAAGAAAGRS